ncbi:MAG TPA: acetolactate synthase small subunit [Candidatus Ornithospirochaeta avicola]|uniref:Acetolactate synthase small subunit n=1 Tax=Candidatus Ornithospirochaeta avicola TaxID=2840896 RepID=A0A9D1PU45_9SPIO|nr:acetolactate synthase small subunit [Candidatus Ornithospirochaeta avicola]
MEKHTLSILVNNTSGVLMRVVSLFSRRGYNIDTLSVGETENPQISRITIVVSAARSTLEQIKRQVGKLIDCVNVVEMSDENSIQKELVLVKISADEEKRARVVELADIFKARIQDVTESTITLMVTGSLKKLDSFLSLVSSYGIVELARTGITAMERGAKSLIENK